MTFGHTRTAKFLPGSRGLLLPTNAASAERDDASCREDALIGGPLQLSTTQTGRDGVEAEVVRAGAAPTFNPRLVSTGASGGEDRLARVATGIAYRRR